MFFEGEAELLSFRLASNSAKSELVVYRVPVVWTCKSASSGSADKMGFTLNNNTQNTTLHLLTDSNHYFHKS